MLLSLFTSIYSGTGATPADDFRAAFPEFADKTKYPDARVNMYLKLAASRVSECVWGDEQQLGIWLFTAHYLATSLAGYTGEVTTKKVGDVQVSYSSTSNRDESAGWWNATPYGRQFYSLLRLLGAGVTQLV